MSYIDLLLNDNWKNFSSSPISPSSGIYNIGFNVITSSSSIPALDYGANSNYYGTASSYETNFRDISSAASAIISTALPTILKQTGYTDSYSVFFGDIAPVVFQSGGNNAIVIGMNDGASAPGSIFSSNNVGGQTVVSTSLGEGAYGDIWFNEDWSAGWSSANKGSLQFLAVLHELGHAMGLADAGGTLTSNGQDNLKYTVMAGNPATHYHPEMGETVFPAGLQLFDIVALQHIYGYNYETRNTATTYKEGQGFSLLAPFIYTIWDGGGVDTIDVSGYGKHALIDLRQGNFSSIGLAADSEYDGDDLTNFEYEEGQAKDNVAIAYHAVIENAIGTDYNDLLIGNAWNNHLQGGDGVDYIYGDGIRYDNDAGFYQIDEDDEANDPNALRPEIQEDILDGGDGDDFLYGANSGQTTFIASLGNDEYNGGSAGYDIIDLSETSAMSVDAASFYNLSVTIEGSFNNIEEIILGEEDDLIFDAGQSHQNLIIDAGDGEDVVSLGSRHQVTVMDGAFIIDNAANVNFSGTTSVTHAEILEITYGTVTIHELGHKYVSASTSIMDYSLLETGITAVLESSAGEDFTVTDGVDEDEYSYIYTTATFIGTNHNDTVIIDPSDFLGTYWLGTGNDTVMIDEFAEVIYTGGTDTISSSSVISSILSGTIILAPFIDAADVIDFERTNIIWAPQNTGYRVGYYDMEIEIDEYGTIILQNAGYIGNQYGLDLTFGTSDDVYTYNFNSGLEVKLWDGREYDFTTAIPTLTGSATISTSVETPFDDVLTATTLKPDFYGSSGNDTLTGTADENIIHGGEGNDVLYGLGNDDQLNGGFGNDTLYGGSGFNILIGGAGEDLLYADTGDGVMDGGAGNDTYYLSDDLNIQIKGEHDSDSGINNITFTDIASTDNFYPSFFGYNNDLMEVINDNNLYLLADISRFSSITFSDNVVVSIADLKAATPQYYSFSASGDTINASLSLGGLTFAMLAGGDTFLGTNFADIVYGDDGNDTLDGNGGDDILDGGNGTDTVSYASALSAITASLSLNNAQNTGGAGTDTLTRFENLTGSSYNDALTGDGNANTIAGGDGNDIVEGGGGNDTLTGGNGTDTVSYTSAGAPITFNLSTTTSQNTGGAGSDTVSGFENIIGSGYNDSLTGTSGDNVFSGGLGNDSYYFTAGNDTVIDAGGTDTIYLPGSVTSLSQIAFLRYSTSQNDLLIRVDDTNTSDSTYLGWITVSDQFVGATSHVETLHFSIYDITLANSYVATFGTGGADTIYGIGYGASPDDVIFGFSGDNDVIHSGVGSDQVFGGTGNDYLYGEADNDALLGEEDNDTIYGGDGADYIYGDTNSTVLYGGDDLLYGENGADWIEGGKGNDIVSGGADADVILGQEGADILFGDGGNDAMGGGDGNDFLAGGSGTDSLYGEAGADTFHFDTFAFSNVDTIYDFTAGSSNDAIDISDILVGYDPLTDAITDFVTFSVSSGSSQMFVDRDGSGSGTYSSQQIALLYGVGTAPNAETLETNGNLITV